MNEKKYEITICDLDEKQADYVLQMLYEHSRDEKELYDSSYKITGETHKRFKDWAPKHL